MAVSQNTKYALGGGLALVGAFFALRQLQRYLARRKLDQLRAAAVRGEISTRTFLEAALESGEPACDGCMRVTVAEAARIPCERIFIPGMPTGVVGNFDFGAALTELKRNGTCL
jgi:hypothetical protein